MYGWIDDTPVAFHVFKKPEWTSTTWEKRWLTKNVDHRNNINTVRAVIDNDHHLSTRALEAPLHIPQIIIHHTLTEKLEMMRAALTCVPYTLTSNQMRIRIERASNCVVRCNETWGHHHDPDIKWESEHWKGKKEPWKKKAPQQKLAGKVMLLSGAFFINTL